MAIKVKKKDYDLVKRVSLRFAEKINIADQSLQENDIARLGFYYLVLNLTTGIQETSELSELIIDTSFQSKVNNVVNKDYGIDAVYIDEEQKKVILFSFKYRDSYSDGTTRTPKDLTETSPFLGYLKNDERFKQDFYGNKDSELSREKIIEILELKKNETDLEFELYMVTNELSIFEKDDPAVTEFYSNYPWLTVKEFNLVDIANELSLKPAHNNAEIILSKKELLQHDMDGYTTANSYVGKVKLTDLIKISSQDHSLRKKEHIEESDIINDQTIDLNILFDNVRGYLGDTKYNEKIITTLETEPEKFFLFNNGITITAEDIIVKRIRMDEYYKIELVNYQIVNGGQTLRSIYHFKDNKRELVNNLAKGSVLVRFFKTGLEEGLVNKVSEFTNSQNEISGRDLKSVDKIQLDLEQRFSVEGLTYIRKLNKVDVSEKTGLEISMEKLGQLLMAYHGHPEKASNSKKKIFEDYYNHLFNDAPEFMDIAIKLTKIYHEVLNAYEKKKDTYKFYEQKVFYIIYLTRSLNDKTIEENIEMLEKEMLEFRKDEKVPPSRKLIQKDFKATIDERILEINKSVIEPIVLKKKKR